MHGSAPDIAGTGKANPVAMALSGAMMLEHLGHVAEAKLLHEATVEQVREGKHTADLVPLLGGVASSTEEVSAELLARVERRLAVA